MKLIELRKELNSKHSCYEVKHTDIGYWVDGACGYMVTDSYYDTEKEAITEALKKIKSAEKENRFPSWRFY